MLLAASAGSFSKEWPGIYAADLTTSGTGAYVVDDVVVTYRPAQSSAKTDCVDANVPTSGGTTSGNLVSNGDFSDGTTDWALTGALASQVTSGVLEFHRTTDPTAPVVGQATDVGAGAGQRLAAVFELGNLSATRQRVTVTVQDDAAPASFQSCVFWLAAGTPRRAYVMTLYAPVAWDDLTLTVVPAAGGSAGTHGWLELDEVSIAKVTDAMLGTECFEPGSFVLEPPSAPAPAALMALRQVTTGDDGARRVTTGEGVPALAGALRLVPTHVHAVTPPTVAALHAQAVARAARPAMPTGPARGLTLVANADAAHARRTPTATAPDGATTAVTWTASVVGTGTGTVSSSPAGLACGGTDVSCAGLFAEGATVTFTATPASGHAFTGWAGACTGTSTTCEVFIVGAQTVVATFTGPPTLTYYHLDVLGSVRAITDEAGDPVTRHDYAPFGESTSDLDGDSRRFTGQQRDAETALDYYNARYYRNVWGRFTTADDSIYMDPAEPQSFNLYAYVFNNPLRWVDPSGHFAQDPVCCARETVTVTPGGVSWSEFRGMWGGGVSAEDMQLEGLSWFAQGPRRITGQRAPPGVDSGFSLARFIDGFRSFADDFAAVFGPALGTMRVPTRLWGSHSGMARALGPAGAGRQWHHIVEQNPSNLARFGARAIHSTTNVVSIDAPVHTRITTLYGSRAPNITGSTTSTVREWLSSQSFDAQAEFGREMLRFFSRGVW